MVPAVYVYHKTEALNHNNHKITVTIVSRMKKNGHSNPEA